MTQPGEYPANWYPDPMGRHEYRYFDGTNWTEHVTSHGRQSVDPLDRRRPTCRTATSRADKVQK